jgi:DNA polymerase-3 subunit gamma/tau
MRDAQSLLEQMIAFSGKSISDDDLLEVLGVIDRQDLLDTATAILEADAVRCLETIERLYLHGHDLRRFCQELAEHFRNLLVMKVSNEPHKLVDLTNAELAELKEQADKVSSSTLQQFFHFLLRGEEEIRRSSNPKLVLEMSLLRLVQLPQVMDMGKVISQIQKLEQRIATGGQPAAEPHKSRENLGQQRVSYDYTQTEEVDPADPKTVADSPLAKWQDLLEKMRQEKPALAASLERVSVRKPKPDVIELDFNGHEFDYEMVKERESFGLLNRVAREIFGDEIKISLKAGGEEMRGEQRGKTDRQRLRQQKALKHPLVTEALEIFGGEIVEVKVGPQKSK